MSVDLDAMFFRGDFYEWIKTPPLSKINMICNPEWGAPGEPSYGCNGGWIYVQSVRPDGPVAWLWKEVAWNVLRRADDHFEFLSKFCRTETGNCADANKEKRNCLTFDQVSTIVPSLSFLSLLHDLPSPCLVTPFFPPLCLQSCI